MSEFNQVLNREMSEVSDEIVTRTFEIYVEDGRWKDLLESEYLTDEEYMALALIYLTREDSETEKFINLCFTNTGEYETNLAKQIGDIFMQGGCKEPCKYWKINTDRVEKLTNCMSWLNTVNYQYISSIEKNEENKDLLNELSANRNNLLQNMALFKSLSEIGEVTVTSGYNDENPNIKLERGPREEIIMQYTEYRKIQIDENDQEPATHYYTNLNPQTLTITLPYHGGSNIDKKMEDLEQEFTVKYGLSFDIVTGPIDNYAKGKAKTVVKKVVKGGTEYLIKKTSNKVAKGLIGFIPVGGGIIEVGMDIYDGYTEAKEEIEYAEYIITELEAAQYSNKLELSCVYTSWSDTDIEASVYMEVGMCTQDVIDKYNEEAGGKYGEISLHDVLYSSDEVRGTLEVIARTDVELNNKIFNGYE